MLTADPSLGDRLRQRLSKPYPLPQPSAAPALSYGRHRGPAPTGCRVAAVAIALFQDRGGEWTIPLTLRPTTLQHHGGQICLPGGMLEPGEVAAAAALREFEEELGVRPQVAETCGMLSTQYVYASDNLVHPFVVTIQTPQRRWIPDPVEVAGVVQLPLSVLLAESAWTRMTQRKAVVGRERPVGQLEFHAMAIRHTDHLIWGATAVILDQLARILRTL